MIVQYASDLHLVFGQNFQYVMTHGIYPVGDCLVLAGDVADVQSLSRYDSFWDWCSANFKQTLFVPGNHDWYGKWDSFSQLTDRMEIFIRSNVRCCNNAAVRIGDTDFLCSTLWSNLTPATAPAVSASLLDFRKIYFGDKRLTAEDYVGLHRASLNFLQKAVSDSDAKRIIVVTHHVPTMATVCQNHKLSSINAGFATELGNWIVETRIDHWIYGHSHVSIDTKIGRTRIVSNQLGYIMFGEGASYSECKTFEI